MSAEVPTIREELDRKVVETLEWAVHARDTGRLDPKAYSGMILAVWMVSSGLVPKETMDIIKQTREEMNSVFYSKVSVFLHRENPQLIAVKESECGFEIDNVNYVEDEKNWLGQTHRRQYESAAEARAKCAAFKGKLGTEQWLQL